MMTMKAKEMILALLLVLMVAPVAGRRVEPLSSNKKMKKGVRGKISSSDSWTRRSLKGGMGDDGGGDDSDTGFPDFPDIDIDADICFSDRSTVSVEGVKTPIEMKDLTVGAKVLTNDGTYQTVYAWGHRNVHQKAMFLQFYGTGTGTGGVLLEITGQHLVYLANKANPIRADSVKVGDVLVQQVVGTDTVVTTTTVQKIRQVTRRGVYAPLTTTGTIVVNGIHASSYIALQQVTDNGGGWIQWKRLGIHLPMSQQDFVHIVLSPYRMFCSVGGSTCGKEDEVVVDDDSEEEEGIPSYVRKGMDFVRWVEKENQSLGIQFPLLIISIMLFGTLMFMENTLGGPTIAPVLIIFLGSLFIMMKIYGVTVRGGRTTTTTTGGWKKTKTA